MVSGQNNKAVLWSHNRKIDVKDLFVDNEYGYACRLLDLVRFIHEYDNGKVPTPTASGVQTPSGAQTPVLRAF